MSNEDKTLNESTQKILCNLVNQAIDNVGVSPRISDEDMQVMIDKAVAMEKTLQEIEANHEDLEMNTEKRLPEPFGVCPKCGKSSEPFQIGSSWWQCCDDHLLAWVFPDGMQRMEHMLTTAEQVHDFMQCNGFTIIEASMNHERDKIQNELYMDAIKAIVGYRGCTPDEAMELLEPEKNHELSKLDDGYVSAYEFVTDGLTTESSPIKTISRGNDVATTSVIFEDRYPDYNDEPAEMIRRLKPIIKRLKKMAKQEAKSLKDMGGVPF